VRLNMAEMRAELAHQVEHAGGVVAFARLHGLQSHAAVSLMMAGKRPISVAVANALGFIAVTVFDPSKDF
jgi:hypothetical protein